MSTALTASEAISTEPLSLPSKPKRRRNRRPKACQPCRARKVRCDYGEPCVTCVKRQHVHLCIYADLPNPRPSDVASTGHPFLSQSLTSISASSNGQDASSQQQQSMPIDPTLQPRQDNFVSDTALTQLLDYVGDNLSYINEKDDQTGEALHFGRNSMPAFFRCLLSTLDNHHLILPPEVSFGSAFGLTNRTPLHPFGSLWAATAKVTLGDILGSLPSSEQCMRYYRAYSQIVLPFVPYLLDPDGFEGRLFHVIQLMNDGSDSSVRSQPATEMPYEDLGWYALLFAVLASGCQFADDVSSERILTTRVFVACSFECLRLANFYVQPLSESIQTTLILEYVIANDSNPGVGWTFLAISARQAESRGLNQFMPLDDTVAAGTIHPIWRAVIHLDSMLAFAFDRRLISSLPQGYDATDHCLASRQITSQNLEHALSCLKLTWQATSTALLRSDNVQHYLLALAQLEALVQDGRSTLKEGTSMQARLEQLMFSIHLKHFEAEVCRAGALTETEPTEQRERWFEAMESNYAHVVEAYVFLKPLSPIAMSWDVLFCAISSGLTLACLAMVRRSQKHLSTLQSLVQALAPTLHRSMSENIPDNTSTCCRTVVEVIERLLGISKSDAEQGSQG